MKLKEGIIDRNGMRQEPCQYDIQNLDWSGQFILNSITKRLYDDVTQQVGAHASGPRILQEIVSIKQQLDATAIITMQEQLCQMRLDKEPAENVALFTNKIKAIATKLENFKTKHGKHLVTDLSALVAKPYTKCSVEVFRSEANKHFLKVNRDPSVMSWTAITTDLVLLYRSLLGQKGEWQPAERKEG